MFISYMRQASRTIWKFNWEFFIINCGNENYSWFSYSCVFCFNKNMKRIVYIHVHWTITSSFLHIVQVYVYSSSIYLILFHFYMKKYSFNLQNHFLRERENVLYTNLWHYANLFQHIQTWTFVLWHIKNESMQIFFFWKTIINNQRSVEDCSKFFLTHILPPKSLNKFQTFMTALAWGNGAFACTVHTNLEKVFKLIWILNRLSVQ